MSKKQVKPENISTEDMQVWTEYLATGAVHDENHAKQLTRLGKRSINLADVSFIVDFISRRNDGFISQIIEQNGIYEKLFKQLGITEEHKKVAKAEYDEDVVAFQKELTETAKALKAQMNKGE